MQVTVTIPDELAVKAQAQGVSPEHYIEQWAATQVVPFQQIEREQKLTQLEVFFREMASHAADVPLLPETAFARESMYQDHD